MPNYSPVFRDPDHSLLHALREDPHETMHALMNRLERTKVYTGRLLFVADTLFRGAERNNEEDRAQNFLVRSAFFGGAAIAHQTMVETPTLTLKEKAITKIRTVNLPMESEVVFGSPDEAHATVMGIAEDALTAQVSLRILANEIGHYYGDTYSSEKTRTRTAEYEAALMGVGYLASVYTQAFATKISIN